MFYPVESLRRGGRFYLCWVADSWPLRFATLPQRQLWAQDVREICDDLLEVMTRESGYVSTRFSLRLSSQLMRGLVRLYQRKVSLLLGDLYMINANVTKNINKKLTEHEVRKRVVHPRPERRILRIQDIPEEERVEERIRNSGNVVANIEEITLKEAVIPEIVLPINDGFGEENPEQALELFNESRKTVEQMRGAADISMIHHSGLDLLDTTTEKSHEKTRIGLDVQMERITEHDFTFRKSAVGDATLIEDAEKDIPPIPDVPIPEFPNPEVTEPQVITEPVETQEVPIQPQMDLELEELEANQPKRKRRPAKKLIIDKKTKICGNLIRARILDVKVELRCEDSIDDVIDALYVPLELLFTRPTKAGARVRCSLGTKLLGMYRRQLGVRNTVYDAEIEEMLANRFRSRRPLPKIAEEIEPVPLDPQIPAQEMVPIPEMDLDRMVPQMEKPMELDPAEIPTQVIVTEFDNELKRRTEGYEDIGQAKRLCRRSGFQSLKLSQQSAVIPEIVVEEFIPEAESSRRDARREARKQSLTKKIYREIKEIPHVKPVEQIYYGENDKEMHISQMLHEVGLADAKKIDNEIAKEISQRVSQRISRRSDDNSSETPLGSLDRTKVDLGEPASLTELQIVLRHEWGTQGTMLKVIRLLQTLSQPLHISELLQRGPVLEGMRTVTAAKCFAALLKLKQHNFVVLEKDPLSLEITNISYGPKVLYLQSVAAK